MATANWDYETKPGEGWAMNSPNVPMNGPKDLIQNLVVYMNYLGSVTVWTNETI